MHVHVCPSVAKDFIGENCICIWLDLSLKFMKPLQLQKFLAICYACTLSLSLTLTHIHMHTHTYSPQTECNVCVCQRAIDLLYAMCDHTNAQTIVEELLHYLEKAD